MRRFIGLRLAQSVVVLFGAIVISFVLTNISGDAAQARLGLFATPDQLAKARLELGLNKPMSERLATYVGHAARGDFGNSFTLQKPALNLVLHALPWTLGLVAAAMTLGLLLAVPGAIVSVLRAQRVEDKGIQAGFFVFQGVPEFWLALLLTLTFSVWLGWLPAIGASGLKSWILPIVALAVPFSPALFRLLRSQLLDIGEMDFMRALKGKGLSDREIVLRHGLRNAAPPFITLLFLQIGWMVGGTLIVEIVFAWPGIGSLLSYSVTNRDYPVIGAIVVVVATSYLLLNLIADLLDLALDPRVRSGLQSVRR